MSIYNLIKDKLNFSIISNAEVLAIDIRINEEFFYKENFFIEKISSRIKEDVLLQHKSATAADIEVLGFENLLATIELIPPESLVTLRPIGSPHWGGAVYYSDKNAFLGVMIAKKRRPNWKTPPNWDGSEKELVEYNKDLHNQ